MKDVTLEKEEKKYYWSPSMLWKKEESKIYIEGMAYEGIATYIFPKLYFITQKGITIEEIFKEFSMINEEQLNDFIKKLIKNKVLVNAVLPLKNIFNSLNKIYDNEYCEEIYYDVKAAEEYKNQQLKRVLPYYKSNSIKLKNEEEHPTAIRNRRSCRKFNVSKKIPLDKFSKLMGVFKQIKVNNDIRYYYASAGGLYPIDIYVYVKGNRVETINQGLYYYNPLDNSLSIVNKTDKLTKDSYEYDNRSIFESSAFSIYFLYNADATMPKYGAMGYIYACEDVGIMVSTLTYISEAQNIGLCSIGTMDFESTRSNFKLNKNQIFVHAVEVGFKNEEENIKEKDRSRNIYSIKATYKREYYPLASPQKRMYFLNSFERESTNYNNISIFQLEGKIDRNKIEEIFKKLVDRHEAFRTRFEIVDEEPMQKILGVVDFNVEYSEAKEEREIEEKVKGFSQPFDLSKAPLLRVGLVRISEIKHILMVDMHHIISDGVSMGILIGEFAWLYKEGNLPELKIHYKDYAVWQNSLITNGKIAEQEKYWLEIFSASVPVLNMALDYERPKVQSFEGEEISLIIDKDRVEKLHGLVKESKSSMYIVLLSIMNILLSKYSGVEDIVIGSPIAGRRHADLDNIIGMFVNTLVMRNQPNGEKRYIEFLEEVKERSLKAFENQDYQFESLVEQLDIERDMSRNPIFDVMLVLQNTDMKEVDFEEFSIRPLEIKRGTSKVDLLFSAVEGEEEIHIGIEYGSRLFKRRTIERMKKHIVKIIDEITEDKVRKIQDIEIITEEEIKMIEGFNNTYEDYQREKTLQEQFEEQVERTPKNIAVSLDQEELTYRQLNERVNIIANKLREKGIENKKVVGIMVERSVEMIVGILGILKSGSGCLPISTKYPQNRIEYMIEDSKAEYVLTDGKYKEELRNLNNIRENQIIDIKESIREEGNTNNPVVINKVNDLLYLIYTSGTTGNPKGVMVGQKVINNLISHCMNKTGMSFKNRVLQFSSIGFDAIFQEMYCTILSGGELCIADKQTKADINRLVELITIKEIESIVLPAALVKHIFSDEMYAGKFPECVKDMIVSGEQLIIPNLLKKHMRENKLRIHNHYGPSETHVVTTYIQNYKGEIVTLPSIGKPINNTRVYILDREDKITPIGIVGELCFSGDSLGIGYLGRKELTKEKFTDNPFEKGQKMYRTGDLGRWLPDGNIEFLGRIDHQIKIRGYRVEPGEIESVLLGHEKVKEAVVIAREDNTRNKYLCGYITLEKEIDIKDIKKYLKKELPEYMVPAYMMVLDEIPKNINMKVDRRKLLELNMSIREKEYEGPRNETETRLVKLWKELLPVEVIGINDNFFDIGGHSLMATTLAFKIHKELNVEVSVIEIFRNPTIKDIANHIMNSHNKKSIKSSENLIKLKHGNIKEKNIFLVHAGSGEVGGYIEFCKRINDDYNCWGIKLDGFEDCIPQNIFIQELAKKYIKVIKKVQSNGPYYIMGWCIGGTITYEIVKELEDTNEEIALMTLVNSLPPQKELWSEQIEFGIESEIEVIQYYLKRNKIEEEIKNIHEISGLWLFVINYLEKTKFDVEIIKKSIDEYISRAMPNYEELNIRQLIYYINIIRSLSNARAKYIPNIKINTPTHYFEASLSKIENKEIWGDYSHKEIRFHEIEGDHFTVFEKPQVIEFAKKFNDVLKEVEIPSNN